MFNYFKLYNKRGKFSKSELDNLIQHILSYNKKQNKNINIFSVNKSNMITKLQVKKNKDKEVKKLTLKYKYYLIDKKKGNFFGTNDYDSNIKLNNNIKIYDNKILNIFNKKKRKEYLNRNNIKEYKKNINEYRYIFNNIVESHKEDIKSRKVNNKLLLPNLYFPSKYIEKSLPSQTKHWINNLYSFLQKEITTLTMLDRFTSELIKRFFSVKWIKRKQLLDEILNKGRKLNIVKRWYKNFLSVIKLSGWNDNTLDINKITYFQTGTLKSKWLKYQINKSMKIKKRMSLRRIRLFGGYEPKKNTKIRKWRKLLLSKPIFKHTPFNLIIDLFIYNNKTYNIKKLKNLLLRRITYKYMYSLYTNIYIKINDTISRPKFFYINIIEPKIFPYYNKIVNTYEQWIFLYNKGFIITICLMLMRINDNYKKKFISIKNSLLNNMNYNNNYNNDNNYSYFNNIYINILKKLSIHNIFDINKNEIDIINKDNYQKEEINYNKGKFLVKYNKLINTKVGLSKKELKRKIDSMKLKDNKRKSEKIKKFGEKKISLIKIKKKQIYERRRGKQIDPILFKEKLKGLRSPIISSNREDVNIKKYTWYTNKIWEEHKNKISTQNNFNLLNKYSDNNNYKKKEIVNKYIKNNSYFYNEKGEKQYLNSSLNINKNLLNLNKGIDLTNNKKEKINTNYLINTSNKKDKVRKSLYNLFFTYKIYKKENKLNIEFHNNERIKLRFKTKNEKENNLNSFLYKEWLKKQNKLRLYCIKYYKHNTISFIKYKKRKIKNNLNNVVDINQKTKNIDILYLNNLKNHENSKNMKKVWDKLDYSLLSILNKYLLISKKDEFQFQYPYISLHSIYNKSKDILLFSNIWYTIYSLNFIKKEYSHIVNNILISKVWHTLPLEKNYKCESYIGGDKFNGINYKWYYNWKEYKNNNYSITWSTKFFSFFKENKRENNIINKLFYYDNIFKTYYKKILPIYIMEYYKHYLINIWHSYWIYSLRLSMINKIKEINKNHAMLLNFILVKTLLGLLEYNYRSLVRLKPKYYFLNKLRYYNTKFKKLNLNSWVNSVRYIKRLRKTPRIFWKRFHILASFYFKRIIQNSELDTKQKIFVPFVLYFEDLLYNIYGKWVIVRLWPLKKYYLSSYILARRVMALILWRAKKIKTISKFRNKTRFFLSLVKFGQINRSYFNYYKNALTRWPNSLINLINNKRQRNSLSYNNLEYIANDTERVLKFNTHLINRSKLSYQHFDLWYKNIVNYRLNKEFKKISLEDIVIYNKKSNIDIAYWLRVWLRPFRSYIHSLTTEHDITSLKFALSGRTGSRRNNARKTYKLISYGHTRNPRYWGSEQFKFFNIGVPAIRNQIKSSCDYSKSVSKSISGAVSVKVWMTSKISVDLQELLMYLVDIKYLYLEFFNKFYLVPERFYNDEMNKLKQWSKIKRVQVNKKEVNF